jgi:hypothetical protein
MHHVQIVATPHITGGKAERVGPGNDNGARFAKTPAYSQTQCQNAGADPAHPSLLVASVKKN